MQDVDRPAHVEALPQPARARRPRVALRVVPRPEGPDRIVRYRRGRRDRGQGSAVWSPERERAIRVSLHLVALLVDRAVVAVAEQREVRERGRATLRPVAHVMPLAQREPAAREAAALVPVVKRPPQRWRDRPGPGPDL